MTTKPEKMTEEAHKAILAQSKDGGCVWRNSTVRRLLFHIAALEAERDEALEEVKTGREDLNACRYERDQNDARAEDAERERDALRERVDAEQDAKRDALGEVDRLRKRVKTLEHDVKGYGELMLLLGDVLGMDSVTGVALVERVRRVVKERNAMDRERNDAALQLERAESHLAAIRQRALDMDTLMPLARSEYIDGPDGESDDVAWARSSRAVARYILGPDATEAAQDLETAADRARKFDAALGGKRFVSGVEEVPHGDNAPEEAEDPIDAAPEPTTAEAFATVGRLSQEHIDDDEARVLVRGNIALLERRMGAMARALATFLNRPSDAVTPDLEDAARAALTDAPAVFTSEEIEAAMRLAGVAPLEREETHDALRGATPGGTKR